VVTEPVARPNFLIIGAQKAASTALLAALRAHPEIWMPEEEDPVLRDPVFTEARWAAAVRLYGNRPEPLVGLKCPDYLGRAEVAARIDSLIKAPKLILIVRNPVARAVSAYYWHVRWGALPIEDPSIGLGKVLDGAYTEVDPTSPEILEWGKYHLLIQRYLEYFERRQILVIHDEAFRTDRAQTLRDVYDFLGVDPDITVPAESARNEGVYDPRRLRFLQLRNRFILKWNPSRDYYTIFRPKNFLARFYSNLIAATDRWLLSRIFGNKRPDISDEVIGRLTALYRADSEEFMRFLGVKFPGWPSTEGGGSR
jgi:hypothetical protein